MIALPKTGRSAIVTACITATLSGQIAPGARNVYVVMAKAADGAAMIRRRALPDAGPSDNAKAWIGALPSDGNHLVLVATNADPGSPPAPYSLVVSRQ